MTVQKWITILTAYLAFLILAFAFGLMGPTLPELSRIAHVSTDTISWLATARALGQLIGSPLGGIAIEYLPKGLINFVALLLTAPCIASVPFFNNVIPMCAAYGLWGFFSAFAIVGINMEIIHLGGGSNGPILQALHCVFNVGMLLAPVVAQPFLRDKPFNDDQNERGFLGELGNDGLRGNNVDSGGFPDITAPYVIAGLLTLASAIIHLCLICGRKFFKNPPVGEELSPTNRHESPTTVLKNRSVIFFLIFMFFAFSCLVETNYTTFLATFAVDYLEWSDKTAASLTSVFILTFTIGRFTGIFAIKILGATKLIGCSLVTAILSVVPLYFLNYSTLIIWISSGMLGFAISPIYATTLSYANNTIHLSGKLGSILIFAGCLGYTVGPFLQGVLFNEYGISTFLHLCVAALICALLMYILLSVCVRKITAQVHTVVPSAPPDYETSEITHLMEKDASLR